MSTERLELFDGLEEPLEVDSPAASPACLPDGRLDSHNAPEVLRPSGISGAIGFNQVFHGKPQGLEFRFLPSAQQVLHILGPVIEDADWFKVSNGPGVFGEFACLHSQPGACGVGITLGQLVHSAERPIQVPDPILLLSCHLAQRCGIREVAPEQFPKLGA